METEIIPVIHMLNTMHVLENAKKCHDLGIKKVFLINHGGDNRDLLEAMRLVKVFIPSLWVGVNLLGVTTGEALSSSSYNINQADGLWCDATISPELAKKVRNFNGMFFGGLAFKYQPKVSDLKAACQDAIQATDVATTSGAGTGIAADDKKIKDIRKYLGTHPMAIASGVSIDNIDNYKGVVDYLLVASSITDAGEQINTDRLKALLDKLKA